MLIGLALQKTVPLLLEHLYSFVAVVFDDLDSYFTSFGLAGRDLWCLQACPGRGIHIDFQDAFKPRVVLAFPREVTASIHQSRS